MNRPNFYIDFSCKQNYCDGERVCGDVYLTKFYREEGRNIIVLADGMGHGIKANVSAILTASMALHFAHEHKEVSRIAETIINILPLNSEIGASYATFTLIDIEPDARVSILEYENPQCLILRGKEIFYPEWNCLLINTNRKVGKEIKSCSFEAQIEDRIIIFSDGVVQSGMGSKNYPLGWGLDQVYLFIQNIVQKNENISSSELAFKIISEGYKIDGFSAKDDTSCAVIYFRKPRKLIICTGPPSKSQKDNELAEKFKHFSGKKIICGGTTAEIIARELNLTIDNTPIKTDPDLPPMNNMEGVDLLTEGILTLNKVYSILQQPQIHSNLSDGPADLIVNMLLENDDIYFLVGTSINEAHHDTQYPIELEIRRTLVRRIEKLLEEKFLKKVTVEYI